MYVTNRPLLPVRFGIQNGHQKRTRLGPKHRNCLGKSPPEREVIINLLFYLVRFSNTENVLREMELITFHGHESRS